MSQTLTQNPKPLKPPRSRETLANLCLHPDRILQYTLPDNAELLLSQESQPAEQLTLAVRDRPGSCGVWSWESWVLASA